MAVDSENKAICECPRSDRLEGALSLGREKGYLNWIQRCLQNMRASAGFDYLLSEICNHLEEWKLGATLRQRYFQDGVWYLCRQLAQYNMAVCNSWDQNWWLRSSSPVFSMSRSALSMKALIFKMHIKFTHLPPASLSPPAILYSILLHKSVN